MRKALLIGILLLFGASVCGAGSVQESLRAVLAKKNASAPTGSYVYSGDGEPYGTSTDEVSNYYYSSPITTTNSGTATTLGVYMDDIGVPPTECWLALFAGDGNSRLAYATFTNMTVGWIDVIINQAVTATTSYRIMVQCNQHWHSSRDASCSSWYRNISYDSIPPADFTGSSTDVNQCAGVRMYVE
jgi:hypothetical protein